MRKFITPDDIQANIACEYSTTLDKAFAGCPTHPRMAQITLYVLVLKNGCVVTGESGCIDPARFDAQMGREIARKNAIDKIWPLMGYALLTEINNGEADNQDAQETAEGRVRIAGKPEVSDAGQEPCSERESASEPAGEEGQPLQVGGSENRRESEQGSAEEKVVFSLGTVSLKGSWVAWYGKDELTRDILVRKLQAYFGELGVILHEVIKASEINRAFEVYPHKSPAQLFGGKLAIRCIRDESISDLFAEAEVEDKQLREFIHNRCRAIADATGKPFAVSLPYPAIGGEL